MPGGSGSYLRRRVLVELPDGYNFTGTIVKDGVGLGGQHRLVIEDSRGKERVVRPANPGVTIEDIGSDIGRGDGR
jgi:hypothetical protein